MEEYYCVCGHSAWEHFTAWRDPFTGHSDEPDDTPCSRFFIEGPEHCDCRTLRRAEEPSEVTA